jgi:hypothetical protein
VPHDPYKSLTTAHTSADLNSLGTIMLEMMDETRETLKSTVLDWSAEAAIL